jgi:hypothetical protein
MLTGFFAIYLILTSQAQTARDLAQSAAVESAKELEAMQMRQQLELQRVSYVYLYLH